jgi:ribonuclease HI
MIQIYTDGSCIKNPNGPGGWGIILIEEDGYEYYFADCKQVVYNTVTGELVFYG